jgi:hypothetical protein
MRCGQLTPRGGSRQKYCKECSKQSKLEKSAERVYTPVPIIGTTIQCSGCGKQIIKTAGRKKFCATCFVEAKRSRDAALQVERRKIPEQKAKARLRSKKRNATQSHREYIRRYEAERREKDPQFVINSRMRAMVSNVLRGEKNGRSWQDLVGFTAERLMSHLERQFMPGMNWDNRHLWQIDHIVPVASFSFFSSECLDFKACWAITNLRPLWSKENREKWHTRTHLI